MSVEESTAQEVTYLRVNGREEGGPQEGGGTLGMIQRQEVEFWIWTIRLENKL